MAEFVDGISFKAINEQLSQLYPHLSSSKGGPLLALCTRREGRFFLPVLYTLIRLLKRSNHSSSWSIAFRLREDFDNSGHDDGRIPFLFESLEFEVHWPHVDDLAQKCSFDTLAYCGINISSPDSEAEIHHLTYAERVTAITQVWIRNILPQTDTTSKEDVARSMQRIIETCFPLIYATDGRLFAWDPYDEIWCCVAEASVKKMFRVICREILWKCMVKEEATCQEPDWTLLVEKIMLERDRKNYLFKIYLGHSRRDEMQQKVMKQCSLKEEDVANVPEMYIMDNNSRNVLLFLELFKKSSLCL